MQFDTVIRIPSLEEEEQRDAFYESDYARFSAGDTDGDTTLGGHDSLDDLHENHHHQSQQTLEQSYERDSRWKPHLSWSHLSWKLQQRMEEQANQRELAWQRISDKLGPLIISSDGGLTFGRGDYTPEGAKERAQERTPFYSQKLSYSNNYIKHPQQQPLLEQQHQHHHNHQQQQHQKQLSQTNSSHATTSKLSTNSSSHGTHKSSKHDKAKRRCLTVSGIIIALIVLLFTLVVLMALGILHR